MLKTDFQERKDLNMRKIISLLLGLTLTSALLTGCTAAAEQHTGTAQGYGGPLTVSVTMNGTDITAVEVTSHQETEGVGTRAIDVLPDMIVRADSVSVDSVSGATVTSEAIKAAVSQAITGVTMPDTIDMTQSDPMPALSGVGVAATGRLGPGTAEDGTPVYSFNVVFAAADFDSQGRILDLDVDQLEVLSSQFSGFPAEGGAEDFLAQIPQWTTKGAKGDAYMLGSGSWRAQMDAYEDAMTGMTMEEINGAVQTVSKGMRGIIEAMDVIDSVSRSTSEETQTISAAAEEQSASSEEIASASHSLADLAMELQTSTGAFRIR